MVASLKVIVGKLPPYNLATLRYTCKFLSIFGRYKESTKMDFANLAMCIGPDLMKPAVDSIEMALQIPKANEALGKLIIHYSEIFWSG